MKSLGLRIFGYVTLLACFVVGAAVIRFTTSPDAIVHFDSAYLDSAKSLKFSPTGMEELERPEIAFEDIKFPVEKKQAVLLAVKAKPVLPEVKVSLNALPFNEPVTVGAVQFDNELLANASELFKGIEVEELVAEAKPVDVQDTIQTTQSKSTPVEDKELEEMFFDYSKPSEEIKKEVAVTPEPKAEAVKPEEEISDEMFFDYAAESAAPVEEASPVTSQNVTASNLKQIQNEERSVASPAVTEQVSLDQMVGFDYSSVQAGLQSGAVPVVSWATTQPRKPNAKPNKPSSTKPDNANPLTDVNNLMGEPLVSSKKPGTHHSKMTIMLTSTDLNKPQSETGFQIRFQDDLSSALEDYNSGSVTIEENLARARMVRSTAILKRGFIPTNNDLIFEAGESTLSVPVIEEAAFNKLMEKYGARGALGAVLVELDDETEDVTLDVPFGEVLTLKGDLSITSKKDYRYKLFVAAKAGNALLSYKRADRQIVSKIIHVHDHEVTFDANLYENLNMVRLELKEEELLFKGASPLITSAENVKIFSTTKTSKKINDRTYSLDFGQSLMGDRRYVELNHQDEPIFIGFKDNKTIDVPSENFMKHIIRTIEGEKLTHHCVIQINLTKKVDSVVSASESLDETLETHVQMLDSDGKFYESASDKTRKIIIAGESHASEVVSKDARVNVKINYVDGSVDFVGSYCSPNTYLVEQL